MSRGLGPFRVNLWLVLPLCTLAAILLSMALRERTSAQEPLEKPPEGQTFVGVKDCASCHIEQFMTWRETPHAKAFEILPEKYRGDATCLPCHSTGHGQPTGFTSLAQTPNLVGNSCEGCHGPGSKHSEIAKSFGQQKLTEQQQAYVRSTTHRIQSQNACLQCHLAASHKPHPPYDK